MKKIRQIRASFEKDSMDDIESLCSSAKVNLEKIEELIMQIDDIARTASLSNLGLPLININDTMIELRNELNEVSSFVGYGVYNDRMDMK